MSTNLKPEEIQNLTEVINQYIASQTSSALSKLLSEPVKYNVMILNKEYFNFRNIQFPSDEIQMCAVRLNGKGDTHIEVCYAIKLKYAKKIASKLLCEEETDEISELGSSAIQEVANIMTGSFFNAISSGTGFRVELSTPNYQQGNLNSFLNGSAKDILKPNSSTVITDAELIGTESGIRIHMLIMQNANNARKLLNQIKNSKNKEFQSINDSDSKFDDINSDNQMLSDREESTPELDSLLEEFENQKEASNQWR